MIKKLTVGLLCLLMVFNVFSFNGQSADNETEAVVYLDSTVSESGNGSTAAEAFKTLNEAIAAVDTKNADKRMVKVIGECVLPSSIVTHTNMITLCGNSGTADKLVFTESVLGIGGPLTIDSITLHSKGDENKYQYAIYAYRNQLVLGNSVVLTGEPNNDWNKFRTTIGTGGYSDSTTSSTASHKLTINSGKIWYVMLGESALKDTWSRDINGVDFVMNGGDVFTVTIGGNAWSGMRGENNYKGNVNITVNGGKIQKNIIMPDNKENNGCPPKLNGNAVQILLNNGVSVSELPTASQIEGFGGKLYILKSENKNGCYLSTTSTAGEFSVTATNGLAALATDENGNKTYSEDGLLKLSNAGTYTVSFVPAQISQTVYVDGLNGSDENSGLSAAAALKTLGRAVTLLENSEHESPTVKIVGTYTVDSSNQTLPKHTKAITLSGADGSAVLKITAAWTTNGAVMFKDIKLTLSSNNDIYTMGGELTVGENVTIADWPYLRFYTGLFNLDNTSFENATLKSGNIDALWVGTNRVTDANGKTAAGANITVDGAQLRYLRLGGHGYEGASPSTFHDTIFNGNVTVTVNSGQIGNILVMSPEGSSQNTRDTVFNSAVQIIVNENGFVGSLPEISAAGGVWYMNGHGQSGGTIKATDTAGKFKVEGEKTAFAYAEDGSAVYKSDDEGYLTLPPGNYKVSYTDDDSFANSGSLVKFFKSATVDFSKLIPTEKSGKMFIGWKKVDSTGGSFVTDGQMNVGDELAAEYIDVSSDNSNNASAFYAVGTQVRLSDNNKKKDLRFIIEVGNDILNKSEIEIGEYGAVALPSAYLEVSELYIDGKRVYNTNAELDNLGVYSYNGVNYTPAVIKAEKIYKAKSDSQQYTLCLTGISAKKFSTLYAVRGYIKYTDANGVDRVAYTDCFEDSMFKAAERMLSTEALSDSDREPLNEIISSCITALREKYDYNNTSTSINYSVNYEEFTMDDNVVEKNDGTTAMTYRQFDGTNLIVRDVDIAAVSGNSNPDEPVCVIQVTDTHMNYINSTDIAENNPAIMSNLTKRGVNNMNNYKGRRNYDRNLVNAVNAFEFAKAYGDQTMVTGDIIDFLAHGSMDLMKRYICNFDESAILLQGNHDVERANSGVKDLSSLESRNSILDEHWQNDLFYASKILKNKVMVIQLDNGHNKFYDEQATNLAKDLDTARERNLTVLIFAHIQIDTGDAAGTIYRSMLDSDPHPNGLNVNTFIKSGREGDVVDLIKHNGDIIKGVFTGHQHADFYTEINAVTNAGDAVKIPQYVLTGNFYDYGHLIKINVK